MTPDGTDGKTPRTDELLRDRLSVMPRPSPPEYWTHGDAHNFLCLARQLERELAQTAAQLAECREGLDRYATRDAVREDQLTAALAERDAARELLREVVTLPIGEAGYCSFPLRDLQQRCADAARQSSATDGEGK